MSQEPKRWRSAIEFIKLRKAIPVVIEKNNCGVTILNSTLKITAGGYSFQEALETFQDHLFMDYYDYDLNPGVQSENDAAYGRRLRGLFRRTSPGGDAITRPHLIDFHA